MQPAIRWMWKKNCLNPEIPKILQGHWNDLRNEVREKKELPINQRCRCWASTSIEPVRTLAGPGKKYWKAPKENLETYLTKKSRPDTSNNYLRRCWSSIWHFYNYQISDIGPPTIGILPFVGLDINYLGQLSTRAHKNNNDCAGLLQPLLFYQRH